MTDKHFLQTILLGIFIGAAFGRMIINLVFLLITLMVLDAVVANGAWSDALLDWLHL